MVRRRFAFACVVLLGVVACGGDEFSDTPGSGGAGATGTTGGSAGFDGGAGVGASGGSGGVAGSGGGAGIDGGGAGGIAGGGTGGTGGTGGCNAAPAELVVSSQSGAFDIAVDGLNVFWTRNVQFGSIQRKPKSGGVATLVAGALPYPAMLALDSSQVYWTSRLTPGTVNRVPKAGGTVASLAQNQSNPTGIALDETHVYWTNSAAGAAGGVRRLPIGASSTPEVVHPSGVCNLVVLTDLYVIFGTDSSVVRLDKGAPGANPWTAQYTDLWGLAANNTHLFLGLHSAAGKVVQFAHGSTVPTELDSGSYIHGMDYDGGYLYYLRGTETSWELVKTNSGGSSKSVIGCGAGHARELAIDATHVYFTTEEGDIRRIPK